jgi:hypothetical protein
MSSKNVSTLLKTNLSAQIQEEAKRGDSFVVHRLLFNCFGHNGAILLAFLIYQRDRLIRLGRIDENYPMFQTTLLSLSANLDMGIRTVRKAKKLLIDLGVLESYGLGGHPPKEQFLINDAKIYYYMKRCNDKLDRYTRN